jgi:hypothetical protein
MSMGHCWDDYNDRGTTKVLGRNLYESHCVHHTAHVADGSANAIKITFPSNTYFCTGCSCTQNLFKNNSIITTFTNFRMEST